jgi:2-keto-3-deoxy-L-rhamnonate aldolase RhmA
MDVTAMCPDQPYPAGSQQRISTIGRRTVPRPAHRARRPFELLLFATDTALVEEAARAGMDGFIVDWERRGKARRQAGEGTQINYDTLSDLRRVRAVTDATVICRLNGFGAWTPREVDQAIDAGADELLLPMVRGSEEVDRTLEMVGDRCGLGILIETRQGVRATPDLVTRPLSRVYVGLNDLRIDRGSNELFEPLVDGTVERVRSHAGALRFGVAGLTLPDRGDPVPSRLLAAELLRIGADFTFLRRSFLADTGGRQLTPAVSAIRTHLMELADRTAAQELTDRRALVSRLTSAAVLPA